MRRALYACLVVAVLLPAGALAADPAALALVKEELAGIEDVPSQEKIKQIAGAEEALREIANDASLAVTTRARAVVALQNFPTPATEAYLRALLADPKAHESLRVRAPIALAAGFQDRSLPWLTPVLAADDNKFVRKAVAQAVAKVGTADALSALKERTAVEKDPVVKKTLEELTRGK